MLCEWGYSDCKNQNLRCDTCFTDGINYAPLKVKKVTTLAHRQNKTDKRLGSHFEYQNHKNNDSLLKDAYSNMTINSGATAIEKGDEQIKGIIEVMEELKTQMPDRAKGTKSFSIKRQWLDKLHKEAIAENKEFWYLKFAFSEDEAIQDTNNIFVVIEQDIIMSMVKTMVEDRKKANKADSIVDISNKRRAYLESKISTLKAKISLLEAENKLLSITDE